MSARVTAFTAGVTLGLRGLATRGCYRHLARQAIRSTTLIRGRSLFEAQAETSPRLALPQPHEFGQRPSGGAHMMTLSNCTNQQRKTHLRLLTLLPSAGIVASAQNIDSSFRPQIP